MKEVVSFSLSSEAVKALDQRRITRDGVLSRSAVVETLILDKAPRK